MNFESPPVFFLKAGKRPVFPYFGLCCFGFMPLEIGGSSSRSDPYFIEVTACVPMRGLVEF